jgi:hydroxypyruvate isomerase
MPNLAANLTMMFCEHEPLDRFDAARRAGFKGVEYLRPYSDKAEDVVAALRDSGLAMTLMNFPSGDDKASERGLTSLPGREADFDALAFRVGSERYPTTC